MSSTYSTNLALEMMGTGDQAGNWSQTNNLNIGTLLEQAVSGYVTQAITDGADTVITIPNGASGTARNMFIECTGSLTGARNLIVPSNNKLYFIYNNTTGGYAVTVKVSGQTGVSVSSGAKLILVSNGTDIINATTYLNSVGVVTVPSGGTGVATLTGLAYGNGTSAFTAATGAQIVAAIGSSTVTNATNATNATNPAGGGSFITSANIGSQSVSSAASATNATNASYATTQANGTNNTTIATTAFAYGTLSAAAPGYQKLPSGMIIQWGGVSTFYGSASNSVTFPITFPNAVGGIVCTISDTPTVGKFAAWSSATTSGFNLNVSSTGYASWIAVGY